MQINFNFPEMLTIQETAERSGLSEYSVRKLARSKEGQAFTVRIGAKYLLNWERFTAFFNCMEQDSSDHTDNRQSSGEIQPIPVQM